MAISGNYNSVYYISFILCLIQVTEHLLLFRQTPWRKDIWQYLEMATGSEFMNLLSANEINLWKENTLHRYDNDSIYKNPIKYITESDVNNFISSCSDKMFKRIKKI